MGVGNCGCTVVVGFVATTNKGAWSDGDEDFGDDDDGRASFVDVIPAVGRHNEQIKSPVVDNVESSDRICSHEPCNQRSHNVHCTISSSVR